ncbi:ATP-binding protein [Streptomyces sp. HC44]|uniref:histidine kinase n=1 Tax=Streptomyces scabichelini TaxID=2711217 RepID=A0A6G4VMS3_9ACTN|nr:histidine kinase [Streptomyces scabichelini]NGO15429.1 ATP-binding protein [Streptomyces scabichelini]
MERRRRRFADALLWAALAVPVITVDRIGLNEPRSTAQQLAGLTALAAAVVVWRKSPLTAFATTAALSLASEPALLTLSYGPALAVFALLLGLHAPQTRPALTTFGAVGLAGTLQIAVRGVDPSAQWLLLVGTLLFGVVFPWLGGRYWRQHRELAAAGWARAAQLEREQRIAEDRARLRERARIAQDMHDSLGHELSLIALRVGALQLAPDLAEHHRKAAADLRAAASDATERLHRIIGLLREEDDEPVPLTPAGETVEELVSRAAESGLPVRWETTGPADTYSLSGTYSLAGRIVHRVVREALTNAARHAPGAPVTVAVRREADAGCTAVSVVNGPSTEAGSSSSGGSGLLGLRMAVEGVGGRFEAGAYEDGFRVTAYVPVVPTAPVAPVEEAAAHPPVSLRANAPDAPFAHARRRVVLAFSGAVAVGAVFLCGAFGWYAYTKTHAVLRPGDYAELRLGTPLEEAERVLPDRTVSDPPVERAPATPKGADCRYYRASGELFVSVEHFRLCFDDEGRLVDKDVIPKAGTAEQVREEEREWVR